MVAKDGKVSSSTSSPAACSPAAAGPMACTRPSRPRRRPIQEENRTLATITFQNLLPHLQEALRHDRHGRHRGRRVPQIYKLDVVVIPTNKPLIRKDHEDLVYKTEREKFKAVVDEIKDCTSGPARARRHHQRREVRPSRKLLAKKGIPHNVLNAKHHEREAYVVAQAGVRKGAITVSTNMAGRGTDILLGGNPEMLAKLRDSKLSRTALPEAEPEAFEQAPSTRTEKPTTAGSSRRGRRERALAGVALYIIGTERHESRRIDNQLRGRAGRQGDPGSSPLLPVARGRPHAHLRGRPREGLMERMGMEGRRAHRAPLGDQERRERAEEGRRAQLRHPQEPARVRRRDEPAAQDDLRAAPEKIAAGEDVGDTRAGWRVLRASIWQQYGVLLDFEKRYETPNSALVEWSTNQVCASLIQQRERMYDLADQKMAAVIEQAMPPDVPDDEWDWDELEDTLGEMFQTDFELTPGTPDEAATQVWPIIEKRLAERERELSRPMLMYCQRAFYLEEIDQQWIEHLKTMEALREGIGLQGYGQKDPKKEYKKAGFSLFGEMMDRIQTNVVTKLFKVQIQRDDAPEIREKDRHLVEKGAANKSEEENAEEEAAIAAAERAAGGGRRRGGRPAAQAQQAQGDVEKGEPVRRERPKVGRNDPCPCGSGKKYKKCHGKDEEAAASE
jgi:preprotein translocase subunit SecA